MDKHGEDAMTQARQPEGVQRSDAGAPAQPMHVLVDATVGTPQRAYQEGWNACADAMLTATGETRDQLAKRLVAEAAGLDAIKLPPHDPTTGIEAILGENFQADDKEAAWKTIKAYADIHARRAVLLAQADAGAAAAPSSTTEEGRILSQVCDLFHIGKLARTESTILTNVSNVIRLSRLLRAVERDLFPEPDLPDDEDDEVSATPRAWMRLPAQATDCLGDGLAGWIAVSDRLPGPMEFCDWLMPPTELKRERWILANECLVTASLPGKATHWRASTPLPPAPKE